ncbi:MAG: hypothetical protein EOP48_04500 [Sphingobacteriales bacterium]|nr:MAG: hypothetical protein EOP48_04500 [Sphingobacteriales bacterium]
MFLDPKENSNNQEDNLPVNQCLAPEDESGEEGWETAEEDYDDSSDFDEGDDYDTYGTSGEKYGWYNGYSDDVIDDAFEGDPENTWNVD